MYFFWSYWKIGRVHMPAEANEGYAIEFIHVGPFAWATAERQFWLFLPYCWYRPSQPWEGRLLWSRK
jgi:hypothetical protein